jgi:hypothetical protein
MYVWWKYWSGQTTFSKGPAQWMDNYRGQLPEKRAAPVCMYILFTNVCIRKFARHIHIYVCMYVRTVCISESVFRWVNVCMYVCMFVNICVMDNWIQFIPYKCFSCAPQQEMVSLALYYPAYPAVLSRERSGACEYDSMHVRMNGGI